MLREITIERKEEAERPVCLSEVSSHTPIFAKQNGKLSGMVIDIRGMGWVLKIGGRACSSGYHETRLACLETAMKYGHTFFVEE